MLTPRPNPDALLSQVGGSDSTENQGRLKVYLGMAAGVGKTYSMLADAREALRLGSDVVIGYLEPHGRKDTEEQAEGLPKLPLQTIAHRGVDLYEFNLDAAIERRPELLLVDELAHTNAPGSRHGKRWKDIVELLDTGINVATTVNIQHVESLRDVVAQITGVFVQETVPDAFFERANEIELVDIPPEELQNRLRKGKVYGAEKIEQALQGFFKRGNLLALRELSLRHTAERIDVDLRRARNQTHAAQPWHAGERILISIAPNRMARKVIRAARRLANSLHAELIAIHVSSPRQDFGRPEDREELDHAMRLAEELGAKTATLAGDDVVAEILGFARQENVTTIVMGKPVRPRWKELLFGSVVDQTVRQSGEIDVLVISGDEAEPTASRRSSLRSGSAPPQARGYVEAVLWVALATGLGHLVASEIRHANIIMLYLVGVIAVALRYGRQESLLVSLLSVAAFNFFYVPPLYTFVISDFQYSITFAVLLAVGYLISSLTIRLKDQSRASSERERHTSALYDLSRKLAATQRKSEMAAYSAEKVTSLVGVPSAVFRRTSTGQLSILSPSTTGFEQGPNESAVASWVMENGKAAGATTDTLAGSCGYYLPLIGAAGSFGALAVDLRGVDALDTTKRHLIESIASQLSTALERAQYAKSSQDSKLRAEREEMRGDLLSAVSHDLRTPLASITGAATALAQQSDLSPQSLEMATTIQEESDRLGRLVRNLLDMTRVQGKVELSLDWQSLDDLISNAVLRTEKLFDHPVTQKLSPDVVLVKVDGLLIEQVIVNLLENASRHAGRTAQVTIESGRNPQNAWVEVSDDGPGIPASQSGGIFARFNKLGTGGFGLGLTICKAALEAHGGSIELLPGTTGARFRFKIPLPAEVPHG